MPCLPVAGRRPLRALRRRRLGAPCPRRGDLLPPLAHAAGREARGDRGLEALPPLPQQLGGGAASESHRVTTYMYTYYTYYIYVYHMI